MATKFWICYQNSCGYRGLETEFRHPEGGHECPKCKLEDAAFPWRKFRCLGCGFEEEQGVFFASGSRFGKTHNADLDPDPIDEKFEYRCSELNNDMCDSTTYEQIDDSTEPPKCLLFDLRRSQESDGTWVFDTLLNKQQLFVAALDVKRCPLGLRITVRTTRHNFSEVEAEAKLIELTPGKFVFHGDAFFFEDPFDVKDGQGYGLVIPASKTEFEDFDPWIPLYVPRHQDRSSEEWLKRMMKKRKQKR